MTDLRFSGHSLTTFKDNEFRNTAARGGLLGCLFAAQVTIEFSPSHMKLLRFQLKPTLPVARL